MGHKISSSFTFMTLPSLANRNFPMDRRQWLKAASFSALFSGAVGCAESVSLKQSVASAALPDWPKQIQRIAFGSCLDQNKAQPIWAPILASKPDLFIFGGDNVYASRQPWLLANLESAYATQAAQAGFAKLRQEIPHVAIWDDHDMGLNDGGAEFPHKQTAKNAFMDFWRLPADDPRRNREGLYHALTFGPPGQRVQIILLDTRWFRSRPRVTDQRDAPGKERYVADTDPQKTMLGEAQWQWLDNQLKQPADVRLIVSGVQVVVEGHGWEGWHNFPLEQEKLRRLLMSTRANGAVFLSGDRHIGAVYKSLQSQGYPLFELTSSGMTHAWSAAKEAGPNRLGSLVTQNHFALIDIDWGKRQLQLGFQNTQGEWLQKENIKLSDLQ
jgi:alkaline phosphatase D